LDILVFTNSPRVKESFRVKRTNEHFGKPQFSKLKKLSEALRDATEDTLVYVDIARLEEVKYKKILRNLRKDPRIHFAVIDPTNHIKDPADIFHQNAVDYVNKQVLAKGVTAKRINRIIRHLLETKRISELESLKKSREAPRLPAKDWRSIVSGREYTFYLMFIEIDGKEEMEKRYDRSNLQRALASVRGYIERSVTPFGGRIWLWSEFGGIILFPFDGAESRAVKFGFRFMLYKHFYDIEESQFPNFLSYRLAVHMGNLVYTDRHKGHIISDSLNSVFHLGHQFAQAGNFYVTEEVLDLSGEIYRSFFVEEGVFEGRQIYRMRHPLHSGRAVEEL
jgi:hypothetical protein